MMERIHSVSSKIYCRQQHVRVNFGDCSKQIVRWMKINIHCFYNNHSMSTEAQFVFNFFLKLFLTHACGIQRRRYQEICNNTSEGKINNHE